MNTKLSSNPGITPPMRRPVIEMPDKPPSSTARPEGGISMSTAPIAFLRKVACVNSKYKRVGHCTPLKADGYAHHPYDFRHAPNFQYPGADNATLGTLSNLTRGLDKLSRAGSLRKTGGGKLPLYLTEFGYETSPPDRRVGISLGRQARYLQQAAYLAWRMPRACMCARRCGEPKGGVSETTGFSASTSPAPSPSAACAT